MSDSGKKDYVNEIRNLKPYEVLKEEFLPDVNSEALLLRHKKSGARVLVLPNQDDNKVFYIGFRTPPKDSTGVAHIIEHTVLCGSRDFPVKDPFLELAKGSLNTFLNAMTYPDKTVYPVASCNSRDFANLCHVYMDAVFYPNIYRERRIFEQEGWHYEHDADGKLTVNGVVYNEMKGAQSSPDDVLENQIYASLFPDTPYAVISGGDPEVIPTLTYEQYLDFHSRYYHPSNSYIYLYGDMDMTERLTWMDEKYLSRFSALPVDSRIAEQPAFRKPVEVRAKYAVLLGESGENQSSLSYNLVLPGRDVLLNAAFRVLDYVLCDAEGAPLKKVLADRGIGKEITSLYEDGVNQPTWSLMAKYADSARTQEFVQTVRDELKRLADGGLDPDAVAAGINYHEFRYREADFGSYPKGLIFGLSALDTWLYDEEQPWLYLTEGAAYERLKRAGTAYFEDLIRRYFLENTHRSVVILEPDENLSARKAEEQEKRLASISAAMSPEEKEAVLEEERSLREYQETPDSPEALRKIPLLKRSDLRRKALELVNLPKSLVPGGKTTLLEHPVFTGRINYLTLCFDIREIPQKYFPYLVVLKTVFAAMGTDRHNYADLNNQINICTGGIAASVVTYTNEQNPEEYRFQFEVTVKTLQENLEKAFDLTGEILLGTDYSDTGRLRQILEEERSSLREDLAASGHATALMRATAHFSETSEIQDEMNGIGAYRFLCRLLEGRDVPDSMKRTAEILKEMTGWIFTQEHLVLVDTTSAKKDCDAVIPFAEALLRKLPESQKIRAAAGRPSGTETYNAASAAHSGNGLMAGERNSSSDAEDASYQIHLIEGKEAFETAGEVQYVCRAGNFMRDGLKYHGALRVLRVIMGYDYLWNRIRVRGGAYGCMAGFSRDGTGYFVTYRDPHLMASVTTFEEAAEYIRHFDTDERTMTQYIIGTVSGLDQPMTPSTFGRYCATGYLSGTSQADLQKYRDQVLECRPEDIRKMADYIDAFLQQNVLVVVGSTGKIEQYRDYFDRVEKLL